VILAIDIGNTRIKCAVVDAARVLGHEYLETRRYGDVTVIGDMIRRASGAVLAIDGAIVSSVVPPATMKVVGAVEQQVGIRPRLVDHLARFPFRLAVREPGRVGVDRLCAAAGAVGERRRNAIVVDAGSAVTVDVVRDGVFLGGIIAAGPAVALRGLHQHANQLPAIDLAGDASAFPRRFDDTDSAMTLGAGLGGVGVIRESVRYLEESAGKVSCKRVTGGFGRMLSARLPKSWLFDPDLTLRGLYVVAKLNPATPE
jgi:type III pantothenate kinase